MQQKASKDQNILESCVHLCPHPSASLKRLSPDLEAGLSMQCKGHHR